MAGWCLDKFLVNNKFNNGRCWTWSYPLCMKLQDRMIYVTEVSMVVGVTVEG